MKGTVLLVIVLLFSFVNPGYSENKLESWYTYWGLGYAGVSYPDELQEAIDILKDLPGVTNASISLDILGFYWPMGEQTILGGIINGFGDRYEVDGMDIQLNGYIYGFSAMHFVQNRIGQGLFLRSDIGPARMMITSSSQNTSESSDWGFGFAAGLGYGFSITPGTRLLLNAKYAIRQVEGESYTNFEISVGGLF